MNPVGDEGHSEVQIAVLAMALSLLGPGEQSRSQRADRGQLADLGMELRQRNQVVLGTCQQQKVLPDAMRHIREAVLMVMSGRQLAGPSTTPESLFWARTIARSIPRPVLDCSVVSPPSV